MRHDVTDRWIARIEEAKQTERNFQLARNEAYIAAYRHAKNVINHHILPDVHRSGENQKSC